MTTAARPTWARGKGGNEQGGARIFGPSLKCSSRDLAAHSTQKTRKDGQGTQEEVQKSDHRIELEEHERKHFGLKDISFSGLKRNAKDCFVDKNVDANDSDDHVKSDKSSSDDDSSDESNDYDGTKALFSMLKKIGKEKVEEMALKEKREKEEELKTKEGEIIGGNPLLSFNNLTNFAVERRWNEDTVFKNQARGETKLAKRFINDTIRSDFHRKVLQRNMK